MFWKDQNSGQGKAKVVEEKQQKPFKQYQVRDTARYVSVHLTLRSPLCVPRFSAFPFAAAVKLQNLT